MSALDRSGQPLGTSTFDSGRDRDFIIRCPAVARRGRLHAPFHSHRLGGLHRPATYLRLVRSLIPFPLEVSRLTTSPSNNDRHQRTRALGNTRITRNRFEDCGFGLIDLDAERRARESNVVPFPTRSNAG